VSIYKYKTTFYNFLFLFLVSFSFSGINIYSNDETAPVIEEVVISGNVKIDSNIIKRKLRTVKGSVFSRLNINKDIKDLYKTQMFSNIKVDIDEKENFKVIFYVIENPTISDVTFSGNSHVSSKKLKSSITTTHGIFLNKKIIVEDIKKIKKYYEGKGYLQVDVQYELETYAVDSVDVRFNISEGKKIKIKEIKIIGANNIPEKELLKKIIKTKKKWLFASGILDNDKFEEDIERLKAYYRHLGYIDMKVINIDQQLNSDRSRLTITIEINEGETYAIGDVSIEGNTVFSSEELLLHTSLKSSDSFIPEKMSKDLSLIKDYYLKKGYIDSFVNVKTFTNSIPYTMNIKYLVKENQKSFINKIRIIGNEKTKDIVIRRELNLSPEDEFDGVKMKIAAQRLQNSAMFKNVDVYPDPLSKEPKRDLIVEVEEDATGEVGFGAGYSSVDKLIGFLEISQSNFDLFNFPGFTGDAQKLKLRTEFGDRKKEVSIDFREPWLFDRRLSFGFQVFNTQRSYETSDYEDDRSGFTVSLGKPVFKYTRAELRYSFENVEIKNVDDDASVYLREQEGMRDVGKIGLKLVRDVRNSYFNATQGSKLSLNLELSGPGGDTYYYRGIVSGDLYFNPWFNHVFITSLKVGGVKEYGSSDDVPIFDRYFLGGAWSVRGFDYRDIGPHDEFDEPLGGKFMCYGTFEYVIPLLEQFRFAMFFDYGNLFEEFSDEDDGDNIDEGINFSNINASFGIGFRILLNGQIPLRFDYAWPVETDEYHDGEGGKFTFDIGQRF